MNFRFDLTFPEDTAFSCGIVLSEKQDFLDFHNKIMEIMNFDTSLMASFFILDELGNRIKEISLVDLSFADEDHNTYVMENTSISKIVEKNNFKHFQYVFDMYSDKYFDINYKGEYKGQKFRVYPASLGVLGNIPKQTNIEDDFDFNHTSKNAKTTREEDDFLDEFGDSCDSRRSNYDSSDEDFENGNFEDINNYLDKL